MAINGRRVLAVIPARAGSTSIPHKNIISLCGKPLISYTIEMATELSCFDEVVVSTNDENVKRLAKVAGIRLHERPESLSTHTAKMTAVLKDVLMSIDGQFDIVVLLQPTSPLRRAETVEKALMNFEEHEDSYTSLMPLKMIEPKVGYIREGRYTSIIESDLQRQELEQLYAECGTVFIYKASALLNDTVFHRVLPFIVERDDEAIDIDNFSDLQRAERILVSLEG